jgi:acyl-CoA thioester hydrolase
MKADPMDPAERTEPGTRADYRRFVAVATRWSDNDAYGHLNNVVYYSLFDTAVNALLIEAGVLDVQHGTPIGVVVESGCSYFSSLAFPEPVEVGVRAARVGTTSVRYELGVFATGAEQPAARGHFVHVYVDRATRRPTPIGSALLNTLRGLQ